MHTEANIFITVHKGMFLYFVPYLEFGMSARPTRYDGVWMEW
jgi:hypothetical protein